MTASAPDLPSPPAFALAIHGGAGDWPVERHAAALAGLRRALRAGLSVLRAGGCALDAVCAAVVVLEDDATFNAGTGCALNRDGAAELDAGVMEGHSLRTGNVAALRRVRNPVLVARRVMEQTPHVLLAGEGATAFARAQGFADFDPVTAERRAAWREQALRADALPGDAPSSDAPSAGDVWTGGSTPGTVGAVALDARGRLAAATSTGGTGFKLPGRVGDSPVPGAGNYADADGAVSATGRGELMLRFLTAGAVCDALRAGLGAQAAAEQVLAGMRARVGGEAGLIVIDRRGGIGVHHGTPAMPYACAAAGRAPRVAIARA